MGKHGKDIILDHKEVVNKLRQWKKNHPESHSDWWCNKRIARLRNKEDSEKRAHLEVSEEYPDQPV